MQEIQTSWAGDANRGSLCTLKPQLTKQSPYCVSAWLCIFLWFFFFFIKILQILVSASLLDFYINLNSFVVVFNQVAPRFLRIILLNRALHSTQNLTVMFKYHPPSLYLR